MVSLIPVFLFRKTHQIHNRSFFPDPDFVSSFADKSHVYFWFREGALEYMNCGKAMYSRVARVCKNDLGGPRGDKVWTSFSKARLNCSAPGDYPYYFDEIGKRFLFWLRGPFEFALYFRGYLDSDNRPIRILPNSAGLCSLQHAL